MAIRITSYLNEPVLEYWNQRGQHVSLPIRIPEVYDPNRVYSLDPNAREMALAPSRDHYQLGFFEKYKWAHLEFVLNGEPRIVLLKVAEVKKRFINIKDVMMACRKNRFFHLIEQEFPKVNTPRNMDLKIPNFPSVTDPRVSGLILDFLPSNERLNSVFLQNQFLQRDFAKETRLIECLRFLKIGVELQKNLLSFREACHIFANESRNTTPEELGALLYHLALQKGTILSIKMVLSAKRPIQWPENLLALGKRGSTEELRTLLPILSLQNFHDDDSQRYSPKEISARKQVWMDLFEGAIRSYRIHLVQILLRQFPFTEEDKISRNEARNSRLHVWKAAYLLAYSLCFRSSSSTDFAARRTILAPFLSNRLSSREWMLSLLATTELELKKRIEAFDSLNRSLPPVKWREDRPVAYIRQDWPLFRAQMGWSF